MLTHGAIQGCGLTSLVVCINDKIHDIREKIVTIRSEIWTMNILSLDFRDIREWAILWSLILWTLGCSTMNSEWWVTLSPITGVSCILTKVYPTATHIRWNRWNIGSSVVHSLNKGGCTLRISCGNSLPNEGPLAYINPSPLCNAFFYQPLCKTLRQSNCTWYFLRSGIPWNIWHQWNDLVFNALQTHWENTSSQLGHLARLR